MFISKSFKRDAFVISIAQQLYSKALLFKA